MYVVGSWLISIVEILSVCSWDERVSIQNRSRTITSLDSLTNRWFDTDKHPSVMYSQSHYHCGFIQRHITLNLTNIWHFRICIAHCISFNREYTTWMMKILDLTSCRSPSCLGHADGVQVWNWTVNFVNFRSRELLFQHSAALRGTKLRV